jgi:fatty-acid desaturase
MSRQASDRNPALVGGRTKSTVPTAHEQLWIKPWWRQAKGNGATLFYLVTIHALLHMQMVVNSLPHTAPGLPEGADASRNIWWLGPLQLGAWGENWHKNHHRDVNAARFGRKR